jgi:hypothetical protein
MGKIGGVIEGLILLVIGAYAGVLVLFGDYWRFLNPKFKWLTGLTAAMLMLVGAIAVFRPNKRPSLCRIVIFLILLIVLLAGQIGLPGHQQTGAKSRGEPAVANKLSGENPADAITRVTMDGREYIRINLVELEFLCQDRQADKLAMSYVVRGVVRRSKRLDRLGQFALLRNVVVCCLADSIGFGFRVQDDRLKKVADGQWVEVYGTLKGLSQKLPEPGLHIREMRFTELSKSHILIPTKIIKIPAPEIPFIFDCKETEPYAF